jgi:hypothetical protein
LSLDETIQIVRIGRAFIIDHIVESFHYSRAGSDGVFFGSSPAGYYVGVQGVFTPTKCAARSCPGTSGCTSCKYAAHKTSGSRYLDWLLRAWHVRTKEGDFFLGPRIRRSSPDCPVALFPAFPNIRPHRLWLSARRRSPISFGRS